MSSKTYSRPALSASSSNPVNSGLGAGRMAALALLGDDAGGGHVLAVAAAVAAVLGEAVAGSVWAVHVLLLGGWCSRNTPAWHTQTVCPPVRHG